MTIIGPLHKTPKITKIKFTKDYQQLQLKDLSKWLLVVAWRKAMGYVQ